MFDNMGCVQDRNTMARKLLCGRIRVKICFAILREPDGDLLPKYVRGFQVNLQISMCI
jgi:hypothetical protein